MLVRIRCRSGNFRFEVAPEDDIQSLLAKICEAVPEADKATLTFSSQPNKGDTAVGSLSGPIKSFGISHGDLLFVGWKWPATNGIAAAAPPPAASTSATAPASTKPAAKKPWELAVEDPVDTYWEQADGKIGRQKDPRFCKHNDRAMCDYCMPLEPYDATYQAENKIKHLSYHAYLRKLDLATNKPSTAKTSFVPPLDEPDYSVKVPCPSGTHASWPGGICTKCQPSAITLQLQQYRMVDHVEFADPSIVNRFLQFWRSTGSQRFGFLLGHYETYERVPMGIRAVVEAIHEPPQEGDVDGIRVGMPWEDEKRVETLAAECGLRIVGIIYTDLTPDTEEPTKVVCKRHAKSFFLSSLETLFAAQLQRDHPNPSRFSGTGRFSSKFVTCVITGNEQKEVEIMAYQASNQAMAMVAADIAEPSVDASVVRIREDDGTKKRYVPDVFYRYKNAYKIDVQESARPCFPVDYLLVSLTHGFPDKVNPVFVATEKDAFPIESRTGWQDQTSDKLFRQAAALIGKLPARLDSDGFEVVPDVKGKGRATDEGAASPQDALATWLSDWHLLAYIETLGIFDQAGMKLLADVATSTRDPAKRKAALDALLSSPSWQTFATIAQESAPASTAPTAPPRGDLPGGVNDAMDADIPPELYDAAAAAGGAGAAAGGTISCPHCTFENAAGSGDCEVCGLPLAG